MIAGTCTKPRPLEGSRVPGLPLSVYEREQIFVMLVADRQVSWVVVGAHLGRSPSTIQREVERNQGRQRYSPSDAQQRAVTCSLRPKAWRRDDPVLEAFASTRLKDGMSPWAVAFLATANGMRVCHETLYQIVNMRAWDQVTPQACLRSRRPRRTQRHHTPRPGALGVDAPHISIRPAAAAERAESGHYEGDLIIGAGNKSAMITLADRKTGYGETIVLPTGYSADNVINALSEWVSTKNDVCLRSLTWDRGSEMAHWSALTMQWALPIYFCDPHSPWQRPVNENFNRQLRWWFPKGTDLTHITQTQADRARHILNHQPRRAHHGQTAHHRYTQSCTHQ
jgi:transposase, IS30 family